MRVFLILPIIIFASLGSTATNAAKIKLPLTNTGAFGLASGILAAVIEALSPATLFKKLDIPVPVPLLGARNTSGVYA